MEVYDEKEKGLSVTKNCLPSLGSNNKTAINGVAEAASNKNSNNSAGKDKPKEKRKTNEKRKEKSRDAARCRRSRETEIFTELSSELPLRQEDVEQLDKASIMRLAIAYLKVRNMLNMTPKIQNLKPVQIDEEISANIENNNEENIEEKVEQAIKDTDEKPLDLLNSAKSYNLMMQALDGFLFVLSGDGDVTYASENISEHLGIQQIDILGQPIWEYSHQCDHAELKEALNFKRNMKEIEECNEKTTKKNGHLISDHRDFFLRLKCTLTSRGRSVNIKSAYYKVIHVTGHVVMDSDNNKILIAVGRPLPHPSNIEIPLGTTTFLTKHTLDMKFTFADDKMLSLLGYMPNDLLGKSLYDYHHGGDSESLMATFKSVLSKGQSETCRYRFLGKYGGIAWLMTQASVVYDKQKPQSVVCVNYVISELENQDDIYSYAQFEANCQRKKESTEKSVRSVEEEQQRTEKKSAETLTDSENQQNQQAQSTKQQEHFPTKKATIVEQETSIQTKSLLSPISPRQLLPEKQKSIAESVDSVVDCDSVKSEEHIILHDSSLPPVRRILNNFPISSGGISQGKKINPPKSTSTASIFAKSVAVLNQQSTLNSNPKPRPRSVTASVFKQIPANSASYLRAQAVARSACAPYTPLPNSEHKLLHCRTGTRTATSSLAPSSPSKFSAQDLTTTPADANTNSDMNKGYLLFGTADETADLTMLKEEPDDLTHLAPTAGDACISLDENAPLFGEMLEGLILPDSYGTLLSDDIGSLEQQHHQQINSSSGKGGGGIGGGGSGGGGHIDPFINYRDESNDTAFSHSPHLLSPGASKSPEAASSIPSLCSPNSLSPEDEFAFMTMTVEDDIDLTMRAPYIPMNEQDDLPLLTDDLMWSEFSDELSLHREMKDFNDTTLGNSINSTGSSTNSMSSSLSSISSGFGSAGSSLTGSLKDTSESGLAALLGGGGGNSTLEIQQQLMTSHYQSKHNNCSPNQFVDNDDMPRDKKCKFSTIAVQKKNDHLISSTGKVGFVVDNLDAYGQQVLNVVGGGDDGNIKPEKNNVSANLDCWTMNDLLQINSTSVKQSPLNTHGKQQQQQNLIVNAMPTITTIHVPLIAIQNQQQANIDSNKLRKLTTSLANSNDMHINNNDTCYNNRKLSASTKKLLQSTPKNQSGEINAINCTLTNNNSHTNTLCQNHNKRHMTSSVTGSILDSKRIKGSSITGSVQQMTAANVGLDLKTSPQLFQQLMASSPSNAQNRQNKQKLNSYDKLQNGGQISTKWQMENNSMNIANILQQQKQLQPPSNSVLKNLLVSGCDDTFSASEVQFDDLLIQQEAPEPLDFKQQMSPSMDSCYTQPLRCTPLTSSNICAQHICSNPLIGGSKLSLPTSLPILLSPLLSNDTNDNCDEMNAILPDSIATEVSYGSPTPYNETDTTDTDSGVEFEQNPGNMRKCLKDVRPELLDVFTDTKMDVTLPPNIQRIKTIGPEAEELDSQKNFYSFVTDNNMDNNNPIDDSSFLMELCNDDYALAETSIDDDLLDSPVIPSVIDEWNATECV